MFGTFRISILTWKEECGRRDLNPGSQAWKACVLNQLDDDRHLDTSLNRKQQNKPIPTQADEAVINTLIAMKANGIQEATCRQINCKLEELARNSVKQLAVFTSNGHAIIFIKI